MKLDDKTLRKWIEIISNDYMHWTERQKEEIVLPMVRQCDFYIDPQERGCAGWLTFTEIDCKPRTELLVFYVKPEYRGSRLFIDMIHKLEQFAKDEGAIEIVVGGSCSGYKEEQFNRIFKHFGYTQTSEWRKKIWQQA